MTWPRSRRNGPPPHRSSLRRRDILRTTGFATAAALSAGCQSGLPPLGGGIRFGRVDVPEPEPAVYRPWLPDPGVMRDLEGEENAYRVVHSAPSRWLGDRPAPVGTLGLVLATYDADWLGYGMPDVERVVGVGPLSVFLGDLERDTVADALAAGEYERTDRYGEFDLYARPDDRYAAVADGRVVWANDLDSDHDVRRVVDARAGDVERYHEVDPDFATLVEHVGASVDTLTGFAAPDPTDEAIDGALSVRLGPDALFYVQDVLFPPGVDVPVEAIKDHLDRQGRPGDADAVDVEAFGRFASVQMRLSNERLRSETDGDSDQLLPWATWEHEQTDDGVTIRHLAGESVPADELRIRRYGGDATEIQWADEYDTVGPDASITVSPGTAHGLHVVHKPSDDSSVPVYDADLE